MSDIAYSLQLTLAFRSSDFHHSGLSGLPLCIVVLGCCLFVRNVLEDRVVAYQHLWGYKGYTTLSECRFGSGWYLQDLGPIWEVLGSVFSTI